MAEYQRIVRESHLFRTTYAAKMTEIIDQSERSMRLNVDTISKCISDYALINRKHSEDVQAHVESLYKVRESSS